MVEVVKTDSAASSLKSDMTLKLANDAVLKAFPNDSRKYAVLSIADVSNVTVVGGTLEGDRTEHKGKDGEAGMGIRIDHGAKRVTVSGVTARKMWGDGFYVEGAKDTKFCDVIADNNRRQGLSIVEADGVLVTNSVFKNTHGTRPSAGIDLEPDRCRAEDRQCPHPEFEVHRQCRTWHRDRRQARRRRQGRACAQYVQGQSPHPRRECSGGACFGDLRQSAGQSQTARQEGPYAFADAVDVVVHQNDCEEGQRHALRGEPEYAQEEKVSVIRVSRRAGRRRRLEHSALPSRALRAPRR